GTAGAVRAGRPGKNGVRGQRAETADRPGGRSRRNACNRRRRAPAGAHHPRRAGSGWLMDNELADMPDIPDVPEDEDDEEEGVEGETDLEGEAGAAAGSGGRLPAILGLIARPFAPVLSRVPPLVLTAVGTGLAIVVLVVGLSA